jgi:hypothetical protein
VIFAVVFDGMFLVDFDMHGAIFLIIGTTLLSEASKASKASMDWPSNHRFRGLEHRDKKS